MTEAEKKRECEWYGTSNCSTCLGNPNHGIIYSTCKLIDPLTAARKIFEWNVDKIVREFCLTI